MQLYRLARGSETGAGERAAILGHSHERFCGIIMGMTPLAAVHTWLADPQQRKALLRANAYDSSAFEGAKGLPRPKCQSIRAVRRSKASVRKSVKGV